MRIGTIVVIVILVLLLPCGLCHAMMNKTDPDPWQKITFDLKQLDDDGLLGPPDGRRSLSYEYCVPDTPQCKAEVKSIDPTAKFMLGSSGRIGCVKGECLCIGSTHQKNFRQVLRRLGELRYVKRIDECLSE